MWLSRVQHCSKVRFLLLFQNQKNVTFMFLSCFICFVERWCIASAMFQFVVYSRDRQTIASSWSESAAMMVDLRCVTRATSTLQYMNDPVQLLSLIFRFSVLLYRLSERDKKDEKLIVDKTCQSIPSTSWSWSWSWYVWSRLKHKHTWCATTGVGSVAASCAAKCN